MLTPLPVWTARLGWVFTLKMQNKREKINFEIINGGKYEIIKESDIHEAAIRLKKAMESAIKEYRKLTKYSLR